MWSCRPALAERALPDPSLKRRPYGGPQARSTGTVGGTGPKKGITHRRDKTSGRGLPVIGCPCIVWHSKMARE